MTTKHFEAWLHGAIETCADIEREDGCHEIGIRDDRIETFRDAGMLTNDRGLVVRFEDGSEIQVTLVQSKAARNERTEPDEPEDDDDDDGTYTHAARVNGIR